MTIGLLLVVVGLGLLTKAADWFVVGAVRVSLRLRVSTVVVGVVVIGFGTSAPELLVSGLAAGQGDTDLGIGNIIGSNVANLSLVLGVAALVVPIVVDRPILRREAPIAVGAVILFAVLVQGGLSRSDGIILIGALFVSLTYLIVSAVRADVAELEIDDEYRVETSLRRELLLTGGGLFGTVVGAQLLVEGARRIADALDLSDGFVGLSLVAIGTSLPELVTAVTAARHDETDLIVGNLLGSNLFNSLAVGGAVGLIGPGPLDDSNLAGLATVIMVVVTVAAWVFMIGGRIVRWEAIALLMSYAITLPFLAAGAEEESNDAAAPEAVGHEVVP
ncbi:MAG: calcium/sodium antiporter [Acidimicrobiia bacterium]|nr:calcium/sodium antiporter [Acidimicrobiia bacterium]